LVAPVLRVAMRRTRIQPVPAGAGRVSSSRCHALVVAISPESSQAMVAVFEALRYSKMTRAVSGAASARERTKARHANACVPAAMVAAKAETSTSWRSSAAADSPA
jgi:hypothetical protein